MQQLKLKYENQWNTESPEKALEMFENESKYEQILFELVKQKGIDWLSLATTYIIEEAPRPGKPRVLTKEVDVNKHQVIIDSAYIEFKEMLDVMGTPWLSQTLYAHDQKSIENTIFEMIYKMTLV